MMRGIAKWHVFIPNEAFLVAKSVLGPRGAKPPHIHMTQDKSANFFQNTTHKLNNFQAGGAESAPCFHESDDGSASETPTFW